jgi:diguanylate cyclase (GGDEF)-like protein
MKRQDLVTVGALACTLIIYWLDIKIDALGGTEIELPLVYLIPVLITAKWGSRGGSVLAVAAATGASFWADWHGGDHLAASLLNAFSHCVLFSAAAYVLVLQEGRAKMRNLLKESLEHERAASRTDMLTGILNRRGFMEKLDEAAGAFDGLKGKSLAFFDLDRFKEINDTHGHDAGDALLTAIGPLFFECFPGAAFGRIGGDEFAVLFLEGEEDSHRRALEFMRRQVRTINVPTSSGPVQGVTVSIGAAHFDGVNPTVEFALKLVDGLMYNAKKDRDRLQFERLGSEGMRMLEETGLVLRNSREWNLA